MQKLLLGIAALAALTVAIVALSQYGESGQWQFVEQSKASRAVESYVAELSTEQYDQGGNLQHQWSAASLSRDSDTEITYLSDIHFQASRGGQYWDVQAERGELSADQHEMLLAGLVQVDERGSQSQIITSELRINLQDNTLQGSKPLSLVNPQGRTKANGIYADLNKGGKPYLQLSNRVQSTYEIQR